MANDTFPAAGTFESAGRRPLLDAAWSSSRFWSGIGGVVVALVSAGVLTSIQGNALVALWGLVPGVVASVVGLLAAFGVVKRGEPLVTPMSDPRNDAGQQLVVDSFPHKMP